MNYLAHFALSFHDEDVLVGQFIADDVKGRKYLDYPQSVANGILLHRFVDDRTDTHPECLALRALLRHDLGLLTSVAMDIFFDHMLAAGWNRLYAGSLRDFIDSSYSILTRHNDILTTKSKFLLDRMKHYDWLKMYEGIEGTSTILRQMASRIPYGILLAKAPDVLNKYYVQIEQTFEKFYPQLNDWTRTKFDTFAHRQP